VDQTTGQTNQPGPASLTLDEVMNMALQLQQQGMLDAAEELYGRVLQAFPEHADALHFLGVSRHQRGRVDEALALLRRVLAVAPDHTDARNNLGNMLLQDRQLDEAIAAYRQVLEARPDYPGVHANLGVALRRKGDSPGAEQAFRQALKLDPDHGAAHHNLGAILRDTDRDEEALTAFQRALSLLPYDGESYRCVGAMLYAVGRVAECRDVYARWQAMEPNSAIAKHMVAACSGEEPPERASDAFVKQTFDAFASSFDTVLDRLKYRAPALVADAVTAALGPGRRALDVLDAGAGTGLCGPLLRDQARRLVGIDLSAKMLDNARARGVYDALETAELTAYMTGHPAAFDLVVSADTLVYFGELEEAFAAAARALRPGGLLAFTVERALQPSEGGHLLNPHGRYSHHEDYVRRALAQAGFTVSSVAPAHLRLENKVPVDGMVVVARR
jgi:predicted TPR repeat methyltransferase